MIDTTPSGLLEEVRAAEASRDRYLEGMDDQVERYHGAHYRGGGAFGAEDYPENHYYEWLSLVVPRIAFSNPRVQIGTKRPGSQGLVAQAIQFGMNRWIRDTRLQRTLEKLAVDYGFRYAVYMTAMEARGGAQEPEGQPAEARGPCTGRGHACRTCLPARRCGRRR